MALGLAFAILSFSRLPFSAPPFYKVELSQPVRILPKPLHLKGRVVSDVDEKVTSYGETRLSFVIQAQAYGASAAAVDKPLKGKAKVYLSAESIRPAYGDSLLLKGEFVAPQGKRNPGGFDYRAFLERRGISALFFAERKAPQKILGTEGGNPIQKAAYRVKRALSKGIDRYFEEEDAAFLKALFLRERQDLSEEFKDLFLKTGTMHILSVSGFHLGFLAFSVFLLLRPFPVHRHWRLGAVVAAVWFYSLIVGWHAPVVRAALMISLVILGEYLGRKVNLLNFLGLAACAILLVNPRQLFDVGFQLSFLAVFGILKIAPLFLKKYDLFPNEKLSLWERAWLYGRGLFWTSFACMIVTLPVTVQNFYIVTPLSVIANLIVVPLSFLIFLIGVPFFLTFWWVPKVLFFIPFILKTLIAFFLTGLRAVESLPGAYIITGRLTEPFLGALVLGLFYFCTTKKIKHSLVRALAVLLFLANLFLAQEITRHFDRSFKLTALDVGQGDAIYLEFPNGGNLLIDAGTGLDNDKGRWVIAPFLKSRGVRSLTALVASHPHADHIGGMETVLEEFKVCAFFDNGSPYESRLFDRLKEKVKEEKADYYVISRGDRIVGAPGIGIEVLHPEEAGAKGNVNNQSIVLKVTYRDTSFLLAGDIEEKGIEALLRSGIGLKADFLKVPHHGGSMGAPARRFLKAVSPKISVITAAERNRFGHPHRETLKALRALPDHVIFQTGLDAALQITSDGSRLDREKWRG